MKDIRKIAKGILSTAEVFLTTLGIVKRCCNINITGINS